ncbi:choice-of-anchor H family protein [Shewanella sp. KX20019]|uniref:choice-of-anchor H family protein n=1 Tax=Shewanella sp. KX20019 TaxID=2803864 RepID=UPI001926E61D|nr:choice-of-anchor H family protein [Shewanella sp. KX20019]QQX79077.1 choice-of-anchor H family protein [Shewanella sp. KX20019]
MKLTKTQTKSLQLLPLLGACLLPLTALAQDVNQIHSVSAGYIEGKVQAVDGHSATLSAAQGELLSAQRIQVSSSSLGPNSREQVIQSHIDKAQKTLVNQQMSASAALFANGIYRDFYIYDAYSRLFVDNDADGFYQTFSVTFDADVNGIYINERADVFAELYLSRNGGPWEHYYTTDVFSIFGDATDDDFVVLTTLDVGFSTDHYDVLIDLYEFGYGDIVATVSSNEFDSLYALPLESANWDSGYIEHEDDYAGSFSLWALFTLSLAALLRQWLIYYDLDHTTKDL